MDWQVGLYVAAVLLPLLAFLIQFLGLRPLGRLNAYIATGAIGLAFVLSLVGFFSYFVLNAEGVFVEREHIAHETPAAAAVAEHAGHRGLQAM